MKKENISKEQYIETFCRDKRIRDRQVLYVTQEIRDKIRRIAQLFREQHVTASSLADTILAHHIATYGQMLEALRQEQREEFFAMFNRRHDEEKDNGDSR